MKGLNAVREIARTVEGKIEEVGRLPDGSGFAVVSYPLPKDHWLTKDSDAFNVPPMPFRMGVKNPKREKMRKALVEAGKYAIRCATINGKEMDFDPDALLQNLVVGFLGYHTPSGLSSDESANP